MSDTALKLAPRSIATSSAVILSPEVAEVPREVNHQLSQDHEQTVHRLIAGSR